MTYVSGFLTPVKAADKAAYIEHAKQSGAMLKRYGALSVVETWGHDIPDGETTDFKRAVKLEDDETVVLSWVVWPDHATAQAAYDRMMSDPAMKDMGMPFDGKRMIWGGFEPLLES